MAQAQTVGAETNEYTNYTNESNEYTNETNDPDGQGGRRRRRRRKFEKRPEEIIEKVKHKSSQILEHSNAEPETVKLDPQVENFIKLKLLQWDQDASGHFSTEEVAAAMDDLRDAQQSHRSVLWNLGVCFVFVLMFVGAMVGAVFIVMELTKTTELSTNGEVVAPVKDTNKKALVQMTEARGSDSIMALLDYAPATDQWLVADDSLREMDEVSFKTTNGSFFAFDISELRRVDSGKGGNADKLEIQTTAGHALRVWESVGVLEVRWFSSGMWEVVDTVGGSRRLDTEPQDSQTSQASHAGNLRDTPNELDLRNTPNELDFEPPRLLYAKGGRRIGFVPIGHHSRGGGGSSGCRGRCNVPYATVHPCTKYCSIGACYEKKDYGTGRVELWRCDSGARALFTPLSHFLWQGLVLLVIAHSGLY